MITGTAEHTRLTISLLMAVLPKAFLALMSSHFPPQSFLSAGHVNLLAG